VTDKHFIDWENHVFGYGYGSGEMPIIGALKDWFDQLEEGRRYDYTLMERAIGPLATWLLINALAHANIIGYGTSPRFGWISEKGEKLRAYMAGRTTDQLYDLVMSTDDGYIHCDPGLCQCPEPCNNPLF
jgi:hypothetical protein